ncbi:hypothetical protein GCM10010873_10810 [Cypionkella aquatica]|uniref:Uncharacterized protein n=1 Tax=Cypionkella aquatica TaxID=1756042 RepID=A0AA37TR96_9RHOB|nr:hypothetical protein [Cypionkella aquatica]GLS86107.1 hypothetical protein GCM10010873_10810 [Cypionkella aquatica]
MGSATDTTPPTSIAPAPGFRVQLGQQLFGTMPEMADDIGARPGEGEHMFDFGRRLRLGDTPEEAISLMAFALHPRQAIWWGHECLKAAPELLTDQDREMLELCATWVAEPSEANRYTALDAGLHVAVRGPGAWLALAVGWASGSMAPQGLPPALVPMFAIGRALNAGVLTALARVPQDKRRRMLDHYVAMAEVLAKTA